MKRSHLGFALAALLVIACSSDQMVGPRRLAASLEVRITVPHAGNGALLVRVRGGAVDSVTAPGLGLAMLETAGGEYRVLVRGPLHDGVIVRLWVPDPTMTYTATIEQATEGYQRAEPSGYGLDVQAGR